MSGYRKHHTLTRLAWEDRQISFDTNKMNVLAITPFECPDLQLAFALAKQDCVATIDIGRDEKGWAEIFSQLDAANLPNIGIRIPIPVGPYPTDLPERGVSFIVVPAKCDIESWTKKITTIVQVCSVFEATQALKQGAAGLICKGQESGGLVGDESSYILLQKILRLEEAASVPVWCQGGIGFHTAAAAIAAGAYGVVIDSQLALFPECGLSAEIKAKISSMDGSETCCVGGYRVYSRNGLIPEGLSGLDARELQKHFWNDSMEPILPVGQDAALAKDIIEECSSVEAFVNRLRMSISGHIYQARQMKVLAEGSPLAVAHGTKYPIAQGPMTRVSDTAEFAVSVAKNGALPFLALSLMNESQSEKLLKETAETIGDRSWGVGVLGFASPEILNPQLELIKKYKPSAVLLAGGRPSQARMLSEEGIPAYLHVPAPGLLNLFLKEGARHFVFEGRECGGHVGPRFSFVLWEQQVSRLLKFENPEELHILFAGGIHDECSAAMVAVLAAPLAAKGAKIGVLMGSAYISTKEAVDSGAVVPGFQEEIIAGGETVLLETSPGHATRCLATRVVDEFAKEKEKINGRFSVAKEAWVHLENFNVGRLRIATKGVVREGNKIVDVSEAKQKAEGLYMIGQLASMRSSVCSMGELHHSVTDSAMEFLNQCSVPAPCSKQADEPIAIVGMECIYPGSPDVESFWENILAGRDMITEVPDDRWSKEGYYRENTKEKGKTPSKWGGFISDTAFDPIAYGIPPQSLSAIEPVQLLSLEVAKRALKDAGYDAIGERYFDRSKTSVIFGAESGMELSGGYSFRNNYPQFFGDIPEALNEVLPELTEDSFPGVLANVIAGRIANRLDLGGVNYTVDSACASSLTAAELAVKELRSGTSDMVLAGGADFHNGINDYLMFSSVQALSPTGRCRSFDSRADGISLGEGVAVVVLKRLSDAQRDGDRIYSLIDGIAGSSDGKSLGLTAPRKDGQKRAIERACWQAGVLPENIGLVEAHGTGTVVGDKTEMKALTEVYNAGGALPQSTQLGSVKSQIGHTKCAAGIAGLIKISKSLYHRVLPPTQNIEKPNACHDPDNSPFTLNSEPNPWLESKARAAISAFGFGGTNFHAVLSSYNAKRGSSDEFYCDSLKGHSKWSSELFLFRGKDFDEVKSNMRLVSEFIKNSTSVIEFRSLSYSVDKLGSGLACGLGSRHVQCAFVAKDEADLVEKISISIRRSKADGIFYRSDSDTFGGDSEASKDNKIAFIFPGQGSQRVGMLRDLFIAFPRLQAVLQQGSPWVKTLFPPTAYETERKAKQQKDITDTCMAQPTLGMVDFAMAELLMTFGIKPSMLAGHSYGELVALCVAGSFELKTLLPLSAFRGEAILDAAGDDAGSMAAVSAGYDKLSKVIEAHPAVVLANQNSYSQTVISGPTSAIDAALITLRDAGITARPIDVSCAFHSPVVEGAGNKILEYLKNSKIDNPVIPVYSNRTALPYSKDGSEIAKYLAQHVASPVRFVEEIECMYADGARTFIEVGPGRVLSGFVDNILNGKPHKAISTDRKGQNGLESFLHALAQMAVINDGIDSNVLFRDRELAGGQLVSVDFNEPQVLAASTWMVNGHRAWPISGELPACAGKPLLEPLQLAVQPSPAVQMDNNSAHTQIVLDYLKNANEMVKAQRDVMVSLLGYPQAVPPIASVTQSNVQPVIEKVENYRQLVDSPALVNSPVQSKQKVDVETLLLSLVSEKTGYPVEMLDLDLDLEADLSIDSIKRIEIIGELSNAADLPGAVSGDVDVLLEELAAQKNLRTMIEWLTSRLPETGPRPSNGDEATPVNETVKVAPAPADIRQLLIAIVSERTGYPENVLDIDLDLEADLSIDSIKRLEIVGDLSERLGQDQSLAKQDGAMDSLSGLKSLRAMIDWLEKDTSITEGIVSEQSLDSTATEVLEVPEVNKTNSNNVIDSDPSRVPGSRLVDISLARYVLKSSNAPDVVTGDNQLSGKHFMLTDDTLGVAENLSRRLEMHGAKVRIINFCEHQPSPDDLESVDGLIHLWSLNPDARIRDVKRFYNLVRTTLLHKVSYLLVAGGLGGGFGSFRDGDGLIPEGYGRGGGMSGMIKSIVKEWPELRAHWVDLDLDEPVDELAAYLELELLAETPLTEVGYREGSRRLVEVVESALPLEAEMNHLDLNSESVVLLTGGARGITARLAVTLARRYGCQLELVGRSALPNAEDISQFSSAKDLKSLRQLLIKNNSGLKPKVIERQCASILAAREIIKTFEDIKSAGGRVNYAQVDVRDVEEFGKKIEKLYETYGHIDGVIHGAGVIEDKLLRDKTAESFERVFDTKVRGALMLSNLLRDDIRFVVFFSSVAGAFGNRGQVDYASANDALDKIANSLQARIKGRVLSVNWGPWAESGMVSEELEREYASKGVGLIPPDEGIAALLNELQLGNRVDTQVVLMCATPESMGLGH